jgi:hypothetical protein
MSHHLHPSHPPHDTSPPWRIGALTVSLLPIEWLIVVSPLYVLTIMDFDTHHGTANAIKILLLDWCTVALWSTMLLIATGGMLFPLSMTSPHEDGGDSSTAIASGAASASLGDLLQDHQTRTTYFGTQAPGQLNVIEVSSFEL